MEYLWAGCKLQEGVSLLLAISFHEAAKLDCFKGFKYYVEAEDADILILTETKVDLQYDLLLVN